MGEDERPDARQRLAAGASRLTPEEIASRSFPAARKGLAEPEVRAFLRRVADELAAAQERERELAADLDRLEVEHRTPRTLTEDELLVALGTETAAVLRSAREASEDLRKKAEEQAVTLVENAHDDSLRRRQETDDYVAQRRKETDETVAGIVAEAERRAAEISSMAKQSAEVQAEQSAAAAAAEIEAAKAQGRNMLDEAKQVRERVLQDLTRRRVLVTAQIEELRTGRDRLLDAYRTVKQSFLDATQALTKLDADAAQTPALDDDEIDRLLSTADLDDVVTELVSAESSPDTTVEPLPVSPSAEATADSDGDADADADGDADADADADADGDGDEPKPEVGDLFARLRAERGEGSEGVDDPERAPADPAPDAPVTAEVTVVEPVPDPPVSETPVPEVPTDPLPDLVRELTPGAARRAKRVAQDEQNEILDAVRRHKGKTRPESASVLPPSDAQVATWVVSLGDAISPAYRAGVESVGAVATDADTVLHDLVGALVAPLRSRLVHAVDDVPDLGSDTTTAIVERVSARYREWKMQFVDAEIGDVLSAAFARGVIDGVGDGMTLRWVVAATGCSPDCADNALEPTVAGTPFPSGAIGPPGHPGCRCTVIPMSVP